MARRTANRPVTLTKAQVREVVRFDMAKRIGGDFDGRRHGSVTGPNAPNYTEAWAECHGRAPGPGERPVRKTLRYNYLVRLRARAGKRPEVAVVHVAVRLNRAYAPVVKEVASIRMDRDEILYRDLGYHQVAGWIVYWDRADWDSKALRSWLRPDSPGAWDSMPYRRGGALTFPWHECPNPDALKGTRYEWCQWKGGTGLVDWLKLYRAEPGIEFLAKLGFHHLCTPACTKALKRPEIRAYLRARVDELRKARFDWTAQDFVWAARRGVHVREGWRHNQLAAEIRSHNRLKGLRLDYERIRKMLPKWRATPAEYARYLSLCDAAGLDLRCEGVLYPPVGRGETAFKARVERLEAERERAERRAERARRRAQSRMKRVDGMSKADEAKLLAARHEEIARFQASVDRSAVLDLGDGVRCVLAMDQETLLREGKAMHNCVGCGHYGRGILAGNTLVLMFRKDGRPFVDAEIDRATWRVRQCYAQGNSKAPDGYAQAAQQVANLLKAESRKKMRNGKTSAA